MWVTSRRTPTQRLVGACPASTSESPTEYRTLHENYSLTSQCNPRPTTPDPLLNTAPFRIIVSGISARTVPVPRPMTEQQQVGDMRFEALLLAVLLILAGCGGFTDGTTTLTPDGTEERPVRYGVAV